MYIDLAHSVYEKIMSSVCTITTQWILTRIIIKKSLVSDGQQFQQYQQNEHPSFTSTHWTLKR